MALQPLLAGDPSSVGPHRLLGRLGQGGMGTVYLALAPDDRAVAVKVLRDGPSGSEGRRRFGRELDLLQRIRGPHLVEVLGGDALAATPWIVTRFVPGQRLDEVVAADGPLDEDALVRVGLGVAEALVALHAAGVVHRDLTPGNVLLVDGEPHVIDLGLAVVADVTMLTRSGLVLGTAGYLAPEQVVGLAVGPAADVHAWAATLALAGTGRPPYGTGRPEAVLYRVVHAEPDLVGLPASLADLLSRALAKEAAERPALPDLVGALRSLAARDLVGVSSGPHARRSATPDRLDRQRTEVLGREATAALRRPDAPSTDVLGLLQQDTTVLGTGVTEVLRRGGTEVLPLGAPAGPGAPGRHGTEPPEPPPEPPPESPPEQAPVLGRDLGAAVRVDVRDRHDTAVLPVGPARPADPATGPPGPLPPQPRPYAVPPVPDGTTRVDAAAAPPTHEVPAGVVGAGTPDPVPTGPQRAAVTLPALALLGASALLAPLVAAGVVLLGVVALQATSSARVRRQVLVEQRGPRRRDGVVSVLSLPVRLLDAGIDLLLTVPVLLAGAVLPAYVVLAATPQRGPTLGTAVGVVLAACLLLSRHRFRGARSGLRRLAALAAPNGPDAALLGGALLAATVALALAALTGAHWWPSTAPPSGCLPVLTCR